MTSRLRHIAIGTNDPKGVGKFYAEALGLELLVNNDNLSVLTDGTVNITLCLGEMFIPEAVRAPGFVGVHHFGFLVDSRAEVEERLTALAATKVEGQEAGVADDEVVGDKTFEVKWHAPDGTIFDLSEKGWPGTPPKS
jgi:catechol 2,3-dioxygenase-like lactoylglutathione lyase family enzyme